jgi:hypothetical protein
LPPLQASATGIGFIGASIAQTVERLEYRCARLGRQSYFLRTSITLSLIVSSAASTRLSAQILAFSARIASVSES